jgi:hypothetical protein
MIMGERRIGPMAATPYAPAARHSGTESGVTPPSAKTSRRGWHSAASPDGPSAGPYPGLETVR